MDRAMQMQQYQQGQQMLPTQMPGAYQQPELIGKMVNDVSVVSPNDVPMDGNIAIFPKNDMSEIYCKQLYTDTDDSVSFAWLESEEDLREVIEEVKSYGCEIQDAIEIGSCREIKY